MVRQKIHYSNGNNQASVLIGSHDFQTVNRASYQLHLENNSAGKPDYSGFWSNSSDERIKKDIVMADLNICYQNVKNIPLKRFGFKDGIYTETQLADRHGLGFIAQDVQKYFPKAVSAKPMHGLEDCLDVNQGQIMNSLYGCVQKLIEKVEKLEADNETLKTELSELKKLAF
jgi:hypothetical protein